MHTDFSCLQRCILKTPTISPSLNYLTQQRVNTISKICPQHNGQQWSPGKQLIYKFESAILYTPCQVTVLKFKENIISQLLCTNWLYLMTA